jgi:hypothetical protein
MLYFWTFYHFLSFIYQNKNSKAVMKKIMKYGIVLLITN